MHRSTNPSHNNRHRKLHEMGQIFLQIHMFRSIDRSLLPTGCMPSIILYLWGFLCVGDAGRRGTKITGSALCGKNWSWSLLRLDKISHNSPHWLTQKICRQIPSHQVSIPSHYHWCTQMTDKGCCVTGHPKNSE